MTNGTGKNAAPYKFTKKLKKWELQKFSSAEQNVCIRTTKVFTRRSKCVHPNYQSVHPKIKMCASEEQNVCIRTTKVCIRSTKFVHLNFKSVHPKNKMCASDLTIKSESYL